MRPNMHLYTEQQVLAMVRTILKLRRQGLTHQEVDSLVDLPKSSARIVCGRRGKALVQKYNLVG